jgi:hypothetical protein
MHKYDRAIINGEHTMPTNHHPTQKDIEPTRAEIQLIKNQLSNRNNVRLNAGLPALDMGMVYEQQIDKLADDKFEELLEPYLVAAYEIYTGSPGVANRLKQHIDVYQHAEKALFDDTGLRRPNPKPFNMVKFLSMYFGEELPVASRRNC